MFPAGKAASAPVRRLPYIGRHDAAALGWRGPFARADLRMKLVEALRINQQTPIPGLEPRKIFLVCGCTPSHLQTFLASHLRIASPGQAVEIQTGLFGNALGSLEAL